MRPTRPSPLTSRERTSLAIITILVAVTRWWGRAATLWEWDEVLFSFGLRDFDISAHHPHPPGSPLFIAAAKVLRPFVESDFRALQTVSVIAALFLFPAVFFLARELGFNNRTSLLGATLCAFFPNVWFFGGTAFADLAALTTSIGGAGLTLSGRRNRLQYWLGAVLLAAAVAIRPQTLLLGAWPFLSASLHRFRARRWEPFAALLLASMIVVLVYGGAALATGGWNRYYSAITAQSAYVTAVDSFLNPGRPRVASVVLKFFFRHYPHTGSGHLLSLLVLVALAHGIRRRSPAVIGMLLIFGPFILAAALMLDRFNLSRYAVGYSPFFAVLAAEGARVMAEWLSARTRLSASAVATAIPLAIVVFLIAWFVPALAKTRAAPSPTTAAVQWVREHLDPSRTKLFVATAMTPYREAFLPEYEWEQILDHAALPLELPANRAGFILAEGETTDRRAIRFAIEKRGPLWKTARHRYFDLFVRPADPPLRMTSGWFETERSKGTAWRSMGPRGVVELFSTRPDSVLMLRLAPPDSLAKVRVTLRFNGEVLETFDLPSGETVRKYRLRTPRQGTNRLEIESGELVPDDRGRLVGLRLYSLSFRAARPSRF